MAYHSNSWEIKYDIKKYPYSNSLEHTFIPLDPYIKNHFFGLKILCSSLISRLDTPLSLFFSLLPSPSLYFHNIHAKGCMPWYLWLLIVSTMLSILHFWSSWLDATWFRAFTWFIAFAFWLFFFFMCFFSLFVQISLYFDQWSRRFLVIQIVKIFPSFSFSV